MKVCSYQDRLNELFDSDSRSLTAIANELGVSKQAVSMWRNGTRSPKKPVLVKIAKMYNVSIEWLMGFDVPKNVETIKHSVLIPDSELFRKLLLNMSPLDYEVMMDILERTNQKLKDLGEL